MYGIFRGILLNDLDTRPIAREMSVYLRNPHISGEMISKICSAFLMIKSFCDVSFNRLRLSAGDCIPSDIFRLLGIVYGVEWQYVVLKCVDFGDYRS